MSVEEEEVNNNQRIFSDLPIDILSKIIGKTSSPSDFVWFGAVCVSWRLASLASPKHFKLPSSLPLLLLPSSSTTTSSPSTTTQPPPLSQLVKDEVIRSLYTPSDHTQLCHNWKKLHVGRGNCRGSSHGWLVLATEADQNYSVRLVNPFLSINNEIKLPPLTAMELDPNDCISWSGYMVKAVLSSNPSSSSSSNPVIVMAIHGHDRLSFCKPGDKAWTSLPFEWKAVEDVIYYKGLFYAIVQSGLLLSIEIDPLHSKIKDIKVVIDIPPTDTEKKYIVESSGELLQVKREKKYIVESSGELLQVKRKLTVDYEYLRNSTEEVKVFKLKLLQQQEEDRLSSNSSKCEWVEINNLDGRMLFLGHNASFSLLASDFPGCKANCIYFTDDYDEWFAAAPPHSGPCDLVVYNLEDGSFEPHYQMQTKTITPHPIWIQPTV